MRRTTLLALFAGALLCPAAAQPQGCAQCRDNAAATPPVTQRAYRHAITLLTASAAGIFAGTVWVLRKNA